MSKMNETNAYRSMFLNFPDVVGVTELCEMLGGVSKKLAYQMLRQNKIEHLKIGRTYKIPKINVIRYLCVINPDI